MRKLIFIIMIAFTFLLCSCEYNPSQNSKDEADSKQTSEEVTTEAKVDIKPNITEIRSICNLATLECHFNNVAKSTKSPGTGLSHLGEPEREFWIEYSGVLKIGVDMSRVKITIAEDTITVNMPNAEILSYKADSKSMSETISTPDSINSNPISSEDKTVAMNEAESQIRENIENNTTLLATSKEKAKALIENYINKIGEETGVDYAIVWKEADDIE